MHSLQRSRNWANASHRFRTISFRESIAPGYLLFEEHLAATLPAGATTQVQIRDESALAYRTLQRILPEPRLQEK